MDIKKIIVVCITAITINMISVVSIVCVDADSQDPVSASQASNTIHIGMSKKDLFKIYQLGDIEKYERKDNKEALVFDDILTSNPDDTITFYIVDGKVNSWDKNKVTFPTDEGLKSTIHVGMSKNDLLKLYPIGNLKSYARSGNTEVGTFNDILTSDPDDTVTFYLVDGKISRWDKKTAASSADARLKAKPDADADADADARILKAVSDADARIKARAERSRYNNPSQSYSASTYEDNLMKTKQQERRSSVRSDNWQYNGGLHY